MYCKLFYLSESRRFLYSASCSKPDQPCFTIIRSGSWSAKANGAAVLMWPSIARANEQLDPWQQLVNIPPPQSTTPGLHPISIHQMAPPEWTSSYSSLLIYRPRKDERLSWPCWLTCSRRFIHLSIYFLFILVTRQIEVERRTGKVCRPKTDILPLC